jgi:VWFA-related protein
MTRLRYCVLALGLVLASVAEPVGLSAAQSAARTVYVSVMDANGGPVGDMKQDEFSVKEDGAARTITKVERASEPIHYVIMVDTTPALGRAVNDLREAVKAFCTLLLSADPKTQFSFVEFGGAAMTVMDFTSEQAKIDASLSKLLPKPSESVLNEALVDVAKRLAAMPPTTRKVILTINMEPTIDATSTQARQVAEEVRKSGAIVWSVALQEGTRRDANRENLLKGLAANTGGRWVVLQGPSQTNLGGFLRSIAANTFSQYAVTYTQGDGAKPAKITEVAVSRPGVLALSMKWSR